MTLPTAPVTGSVSLPDGAAAEGLMLEFRLSQVDTSDGVVVLPAPVSVEIDGIDLPDGLAIYRNTEGLRGTITICTAHWVEVSGQSRLRRSARLGQFQVGEADSYDLTDLIDQVIPEGLGAGWWSTLTQGQYNAAIDAVAEAQAAATAAQTAAEAAQTAAAPAAALTRRQAFVPARPGLVLEAFTSAVSGSPASVTAVTSAGVSIVNEVVRVTNVQRNLALRDVLRVYPGQRIAIDVTMQRIVDSASAVLFGAAFLDENYVEITPRTLSSENITVAQGAVTRRRVLSSATGDGIDGAWPAGTVYLRPIVIIQGTSHTTEVASLSIVDITTQNPAIRDASATPTRAEWTVDTAWGPERRMRLASGGPVIVKPPTGLLLVTLEYGDSTASNRSAGWQDRLPTEYTADVWPWTVMLDTDFAPGLAEDTATVSPTSLASFSDRRMRYTSTAAFGQSGMIGAARRFVGRTRERGLPPVLRGFTAVGIAGAELANIVKGGTAKDGVDMYARLQNCVAAWISRSADYGLTVRVEAIHLSIGSNDTAARFTGSVADYKASLSDLISDLQTDVQSWTGQPAAPIVAFGTTASTIEALKPSLAMAELADDIRDSTTILPLGPEYPYAFASSNHMDVDAICLAGERLAHRMILGTAGSNAPRVLYPSAAEWSGSTCTITVADCTQLEIDTASLPAHEAYGFASDQAIASVEISGTDQIVVTFDAPPPSGTVLSYAQGPQTDDLLLPTVTGLARAWGNIRNEAHGTYNPRAQIVPTMTAETGTLPGRVLNGRDFYHHDWLHNFEISKP